jgi:hypothetical protein
MQRFVALLNLRLVLFLAVTTLQVILRSRDFFPGTPFFKMSYMLNQKIKKNLY